MNIAQMRRGMASHGFPYDSKVEWLGFTGDQTIDTGIAGNLVYGVKMVFHPTALKRTNQLYLSNNLQTRLYAANNVNKYHLFVNNTLKFNSVYVTADWVEFQLKQNGVISLNNNSTTITPPFSSSTNTLKISQDLGDNTSRSIMQLKYLQLYDNNNNPLFEGIPVRVGSTGKLYDMVQRKFCEDTSILNVPFTYGGDID